MNILNKENRRQSLWLAFGIPVGLMLVVMLIAGSVPFRGGSLSMLYSDMYHQYFPFFIHYHCNCCRNCVEIQHKSTTVTPFRLYVVYGKALFATNGAITKYIQWMTHNLQR